MRIEIFPLDKVVVNGIAIYLGMEQSAVEALIGEGQPAGTRYYYFNSEMAIDYHHNRVEFIEFLSGVTGVLRPTIYGVSVFDTTADELFKTLEKHNGGSISDTESGYSYQFQNISVGIYREAVPEEVREMIAEAASFGAPMSSDEIEHEMKRANYWATIGIGVAGYYQQ